MRTPEYLSPSGIKTFLQDQEEFYLRYLSDNKIQQQPQTPPMSIGSAFDAYAKSWLHENLFGKGNDPRYSFQALFEAQVEPHMRDWALTNGEYVFEQYKQSGALSDLLSELRNANGTPRFEFKLQGAVHGYREGKTERIENVILHGRPDVAFINSAGFQVVYDWKVNGYCSRNAPSPLPGYIRLRSAGKNQHGQHKDCMPMVCDGLMINIACYLEDVKGPYDQGEEWATQLAVYHWLLGSPFCSENLLVGIDQLVCDATKSALPSIRVAEHRTRVSKRWQQRVFDVAAHIWECIHSDHFFRDMSKEESQARCKVLDRMQETLKGDGTINDQWIAGVARGTM